MSWVLQAAKETWEQALAELDVNTAQTYEMGSSPDEHDLEDAEDAREYLLVEAKSAIDGLITSTYPGDPYKTYREPLLQKVEDFFTR